MPNPGTALLEQFVSCMFNPPCKKKEGSIQFITMTRSSFKTPYDIPQDLLLIRDLVSATVHPLNNVKTLTPVSPKVKSDLTDISSSGSDLDSEEEVEANLTADVADVRRPPTPYVIRLDA